MYKTSNPISREVILTTNGSRAEQCAYVIVHSHESSEVISFVINYGDIFKKKVVAWILKINPLSREKQALISWDKEMINSSWDNFIKKEIIGSTASLGLHT